MVLNRVFAALAAAIMSGAGVRFEAPALEGGNARRVHKQSAKKMKVGRSPWGPHHRGEKERERALRCYMNPCFGDPNAVLLDRAPVVYRSAPTMEQISKKRYAALIAIEEARAAALRVGPRFSVGAR